MDYDVVIVGGGPAGSTAGKYLAENGISTIIIDKEKFPREKVCAGGLIFHTFTNFPHIIPYIENFNYSVSVYSPSLKNKLDLSSKSKNDPLMAMTPNRKEFDYNLIKLAKNSGCNLLEETKAEKVEIKENSAITILKNGEKITSKIVIGADSVHSIVNQVPGLQNKWNTEDLGLAVEESIFLGKKTMDEYFTKNRRVHLFLHYRNLPGYAWVFPRKESVSIGIGTLINYGKIIKKNFFHLIEDLKRLNVIPRECESKKIRGALVPLAKPFKKCYSDRTLLIGDAGGFVSATTGEGIYYSMSSAKTAAETCIQALKVNRFNQRQMSKFSKLWRKTIGKELFLQNIGKYWIILNKKRCEKGVHWGTRDQKLSEIITNLLMGRFNINTIVFYLGYHYFRCKIKEKFGIL